jgi:hypothetical protein
MARDRHVSYRTDRQWSTGEFILAAATEGSPRDQDASAAEKSFTCEFALSVKHGDTASPTKVRFPPSE